MTKDEALAQLAQSWDNLTTALNGLPTDRMSEAGVTGEWSVKEILGHVALWDRYSVIQAERRLAGDLTEPDPHDTDAVNAEDRDAKSTWDISEIQAELITAHDALVAAYTALPTFDQIKIDEDWIHYDEHAAEIRDWRERTGL
jgi:hypothetical protein